VSLIGYFYNGNNSVSVVNDFDFVAVHNFDPANKVVVNVVSYFYDLIHLKNDFLKTQKF